MCRKSSATGFLALDEIVIPLNIFFWRNTGYFFKKAMKIRHVVDPYLVCYALYACIMQQ